MREQCVRKLLFKMFCLCRVTFCMKMRQNTAHGQPALKLISYNISIDTDAKLTRSHGASYQDDKNCFLWFT